LGGERKGKKKSQSRCARERDASISSLLTQKKGGEKGKASCRPAEKTQEGTFALASLRGGGRKEGGRAKAQTNFSLTVKKRRERVVL